MNATEIVQQNIKYQDRTGTHAPLAYAITMAEEVTQLLLEIASCTTLREAQKLAESRISPTLDGILSIK